VLIRQASGRVIAQGQVDYSASVLMDKNQPASVAIHRDNLVLLS